MITSIYSLKRAEKSGGGGFARKRNYFKHINYFIRMIQLKILMELMEEDGHMKSTLNLLNHLLIMEKNGILFRNILALEVVNK